ncbi:ribosome silencing factor [Rhodobacteraceae bacterium WD3A24]|nr:ribosome silencing factor [Rhodobacteraceae bacterium WD3A24]
MLHYTGEMPATGRYAFKEGVILSYIDKAATGQAAAGPAQARGAEASELLDRVIASLEEDKAEDIAVMDIRGRSAMADYMVVCSGRSARQVTSIAEKLADRLKLRFHFTPRMEGRESGDWVLIDAGDVIVHVFRPEVREFYQLEKMWQGGGSEAPAGSSAGG